MAMHLMMSAACMREEEALLEARSLAASLLQLVSCSLLLQRDILQLFHSE